VSGPTGSPAAPRQTRMATSESQGFASVLGHELFYRSFGTAGRATVLGLHGGPGASYDYLLPFTDLCEDGYRVVLFDLLGCGRSGVPADHSLFTLAHNVDEVEGIRTALDLGRVHLIGSSYGGLLALAYAVRYQAHLRSLITVGGLADVPFASREMARLKTELPHEVQRTLTTFEERGEFQAPSYLTAVEAFYRRFLCRLDPWPPELTYSLGMTGQRPVYGEMNGPNEFTITGTIRDIDITGDLPSIRLPTLVLGGRYDEVTPEVAEQIRRGILGARRVEFQQSSHVAFWEERERFHDVVAEFLGSVDGALSP
jgi:proline iminopeptidase